MLPRSFHVRSRRNQACIRTISLTPPGVSTNSVIDFIINDLVHGSIEGFECTDAFGENVKVFFDVLGFIGDYPAATAVVDLKGHTALAPCGHCGFTLNRSEHLSTYAYTTSIHSCNSSFRRTQDRTNSVRAAQLSQLHLKYVCKKFFETWIPPCGKLENPVSGFQKKLMIWNLDFILIMIRVENL